MSSPFAREPVTNLTLVKRVELLTLFATIPAFYMALLSTNHGLVVGLYVLAGCTSLVVAWQTGGAAESGERQGLDPLDLSLGVALLLSAAMPAGEAVQALAVRGVAAALIMLRLAEWLRPWFWRGSLPHLLTLALGVLGLCGLGFWWLEPRVHSFGDGLWLAFTTAATVGYGDIVPSTPAAKIFAVFVVLLGFAVLSLVTAAIAAMWVQSGERRIEHEILRDLHRQLRTVHDELAAIRREQASQRPSAPASQAHAGPDLR